MASNAHEAHEAHEASAGKPQLTQSFSLKLDGMSTASLGSLDRKKSSIDEKREFASPAENKKLSEVSLGNYEIQDKVARQVKTKIQSAQSIASEIMLAAEAAHDKENMDGEARLCDITDGKSLENSMAKQAKVVTQGMSGGAEKRMLLSTILELQGEARTSVALPLSVLFFLIFTIAFHLHYNTAAIHLQERNIRTQLTDAAEECSDAAQVFGWLEESWFGNLWTVPNVEKKVDENGEPVDSIMPFRDMELIGGVMLKAVRGTTLPCTYVEGKDCYEQGTRAQDPDAVLNGWQLGLRRLSSEPSEEEEADTGWAEYFTSTWFDMREELSFGRDGQWMKLETPKPKRKKEHEKEKRRKRRQVANLPRKVQRHGTGTVVEGKQKKSKDDKVPFRPTWLYSVRSKGSEKSGTAEKRVQRKDSASKSKHKARRLVSISSELASSLPNPTGYKLAYTRVIPMSMSMEDVQQKLAEWQTEASALMTANTVVFGVETLIQNPSTNILTHVYVDFLFSRSGQVFSKVKLWSMPLQPDPLATVIFTFYFIMLSMAGVLLFVQSRAAIRNGYAGAYLSSLGTLLQMWLVIGGFALGIMFLVCQTEIGRYVTLYYQYVDVRPSINELSLQMYDISNFRKVHSVVAPAGTLDCDLVILICLYNVCMMFQFLIASKGHPRLGMLVNTLSLSFQDILHLFVVFVFIFAAYVIAGHIMLGAKLYDYSTLIGAVGRALQQVMHFETNFDVITQEDYWTAALWVWTMMAVVGLVVINIVLAVVFDSYVTITKYITDKDNLAFTASRQWTALQNSRKWYSSFDLLLGVKNCKSETVTREQMSTIFKGILPEQVEQIFEQAERRAVSETVRGHSTLLAEGIASVLVGVDEMRDGIRLMAGKKFTGYKEAKIWIEDQYVPLDAPPPVRDVGSGRYEVLADDCEVREDVDPFTSQVLRVLSKGELIDIVQTQDFDGGVGLKRLRGKLDSGGWISLNEPETGHRWADIWVDPNIKEEDFEGFYAVLHDGAAVKSDISLSSPQIDSLSAGQVVQVVEVVRDYYDDNVQASRVRGRLRRPEGWISLKDKDNGYRFAIRSEVQEQTGIYAAVEDRLAVRAEPDENLRMVKKYIKLGETVNVVEIRRMTVGNVDPPEEKIFGEIEDGGWILVADVTNGISYFELVPDEVVDAIQEEVDRMIKGASVIPSDAPRWVKDGLVSHLQRQHRIMTDMSLQFQYIQAGLDKLGLTEGWPTLPADVPEEPDLATMTQPARSGMKEPGKAALRRQAPVVNMPRPSANQSSQTLKSRLGHFLTEI
mmetsp:Transcript_83344/g.147278  ORF Transcript_83344/g.147278 Transcript_83344/m.147278 type:complete len:1291 (-) Transcript_83344:91-3963(-)